MRINWRRGALRLWVVVSAMWCALVVIVAVNRLNIAWPLATPQAIHVKISDKETWDYPAEWGAARIEADLKKRIEDLNRKDREWLATVPEMRKTECGPTKQDPLISDINHVLKQAQAPFDDECEKIFWVMSGRLAVPTGWEAQVRDAPISIWQAIGRLGPWAIGPPLLILTIGVTIFWVLAGFKRDN